MDWVVISGVADTAAAFGVIGSLIFVGFQVRQNSRGLRQAAIQSQTAAYTDMISSYASTSETAEIMWQGMQDPNGLTGASRMRYDIFMNNMFRSTQNVFWQREQGVFDKDLFFGLTKAAVNMMAFKGPRTVWALRRDQYTPAFQAFMDQMIAEGEDNASYTGWALEAAD